MELIDIELDQTFADFKMLYICNVFLQEGIQITDPKYYSSLTEEKLAAIFRSDSAGEIPLLKERLAVLHETGKVLVEVNTTII